MEGSRLEGREAIVAPTNGATPFEIEERQLEAGLTELRIAGELDMAVVETLDEALVRAARRGDSILVDLSDCEFLDSSGVALFMRTRHDLDQADRQLVLHGCRGQVEQVLALTGLVESGLVQENRGAAIHALRWSAPS
jgi:anti-anti-sigma factor